MVNHPNRSLRRPLTDEIEAQRKREFDEWFAEFVEATTKQVRDGVNLIIEGALRRIESQGSNADQEKATIAIFDAITGEMDDWDIPGARLSRLDNFVADMQAKIGTCDPGAEDIRTQLAVHDLLP